MTSSILWEVEVGETWEFPKCQKCKQAEAVLVPLSDYGPNGAAVHYKAWVCINPECGFNIKIRNGDIHLNEPITPWGMNTPKAR